MNLPFKPVMMESTRRYIQQEIDWMLDLLDKEHRQANTHSQRNHYSAVLRHRLEILRGTIASSQIVTETSVSGTFVQEERSSDIPF